MACGFGSHPPNADKSWKVIQAVCDEEAIKPWNGVLLTVADHNEPSRLCLKDAACRDLVNLLYMDAQG